MTDIAALVADNLAIWASATERRSGVGRGGGKRNSLYGIERLRALILDLAVRGRLVPQNPNDEPSEMLLKRIEAERRQKLRAGRMKRLELPAPLSEWPFDLPQSWVWTQVGVITNYGESEKVAPGETEEDTWVLELEDVEKGSSRLLEKVRYSDRKFQSQKNRFRVGDVIYGKLRPYLDKVIIADEDGVCTTEMVPIRAYAGLNSAYLRLFLKTPFFISLADGSTHGMNLPRLGTEKARAAPIALPPQSEQERIVSKVDELMALCDGLEEESTASLEAHQRLVECLLATVVDSRDATNLATSWSRLEAHFDTLFTTEESIEALKRTVLELAVQGKLVEHSSANWPIYALGDYVIEAAAGWSPQCNEVPRSEGSWGVLKVSAVTWGQFKPEENKELPSSLAPRPEHEVKPGDFLISRANTAELVAKSVVVPPNCPDKLMMSDKIIRIKFNDKIDPRYVNLINSSPYARAYYVRVAGGTSSSMKNVSQSQIRSLKIPVPDIADQRRVVATVDGIFAVCDALASYLAEASETQEHLADAIVEKATA